MNLANRISVVRIVLVPFFVAAVLYFKFTAALAIFIICIISDALDGYFARVKGERTKLGALLDPIADKFLLAATLIPFYMLSGHVAICRWVTLPILLILLGREALVTVLRYYSMWLGYVSSSSRLAKFKTAFQMFFIGSILVHLVHRRMMFEYPEYAYSWFDPIHDKMNAVVIVIVVALSITSALEYIIKNLPVLLKHSRA